MKALQTRAGYDCPTEVSAATPIKVFYNSACPVCRVGIERQRSDMGDCGVVVEWIDIHREPLVIEAKGYRIEAVRERLHVLDEQGRMRIHADAFAALFRHTSGRRGLAAVMQLPLVRGLISFAYDRFAAVLYRWNRRHGRW
jgi:predicted DCC family thiol-disulfide oxidoreductase YuxK